MNHHNAERGPWLTPGIVDRLVAMHADEQLSYTTVAKTLSREFNVRITRNAIIGKSRRLKLPYRDKPPKVIPKPRKRSPRVRVKVPVVTAAPVAPVISRRGGIPLLELETFDCRFPIGDFPYLFCGRPQAPESSYCAEHYEITHNPVRER